MIAACCGALPGFYVVQHIAAWLLSLGTRRTVVSTHFFCFVIFCSKARTVHGNDVCFKAVQRGILTNLWIIKISMHSQAATADIHNKRSASQAEIKVLKIDVQAIISHGSCGRRVMSPFGVAGLVIHLVMRSLLHQDLPPHPFFLFSSESFCFLPAVPFSYPLSLAVTRF